jgi:hypothetical protein
MPTRRDGVVLVKRPLGRLGGPLRAGVARNMAAPTSQMPTLKPGEQGRFFDDYCNWSRVPEFREAIFRSGVAGGRRG